MSNYSKRNHFTFGLGTIGRDMVYSLISMFLIFYLTDIIKIDDQMLGWITLVILLSRVFDALNDPVMGMIVDNTRTRWGKFKPWIFIGAMVSGILTVLLFTDFGLEGKAFIAVFAILYLLWGISYTANDISYWSMLPSLTTNQKERERIGAFARICANIGLFAVVVGIEPITSSLGESLGSMPKAYFFFTLGVIVILWFGQSITLLGVREDRSKFKQEKATTIREMVHIIVKNDQLLYTAIAMVLFMIGYVTTTSFGLYFFKYAYGDEGMYAIFAAVLGVSQLAALSLFPLFSKRYNRRTLYTGATILVVIGYIIFFLSPMNMIFIGLAGVLLFLGQAFIQLLMLMFLADTIEYGQWKLGKRNESITFSIQPFINKMGGAIASGIVGLTLIVSGINEAETAAEVTSEGLMMMKSAMLLLPLVFIGAGYIVYRTKYKIDAEFYEKILEDLKARGDIKE